MRERGTGEGGRGEGGRGYNIEGRNPIRAEMASSGPCSGRGSGIRVQT